jgi:hypothetical protein
MNETPTETLWDEDDELDEDPELEERIYRHDLWADETYEDDHYNVLPHQGWPSYPGIYNLGDPAW